MGKSGGLWGILFNFAAENENCIINKYACAL